MPEFFPIFVCFAVKAAHACPLSVFLTPLTIFVCFSLTTKYNLRISPPSRPVFFFFLYSWRSDNFFHFRYATALFLGKRRAVQCVFYYVNVWNCYAPYENSHMRRHTRLGSQFVPFRSLCLPFVIIISLCLQPFHLLAWESLSGKPLCT